MGPFSSALCRNRQKNAKNKMMKNLEAWLSEYGESHQSRANQKIHKVCVPLIFFSVVSALHLFFFPALWGALSGGDFLLLGALAWYAFLGWQAFALMAAQLVLTYWLLVPLLRGGHSLAILLGIFVLAWIGQFVGHEIEGKRPSFLKDLQFLLIGPLWVFFPLFRASRTK